MNASLPTSAAAHARRCRIVASVRHQIAARAQQFVEACASEQRVDPVETISAELLPLCEALKFIGRRGPRLLRPRRLGPWGRPLWLWGVRSEVQRVPLGKVLVIAAWNYPLLLPGVQVAQALAAGNQVWLKPAPGGEAVARLLVDAFYAAGISPAALHLLGSEPAAAAQRIEQGVDLVVLTGGSATGRSVLQQCAATLTPSIMELSGCDALIVGPGADLDLAAKAIAFGLTFNAGATCIGPRRIIVSAERQAALSERLRSALAGAAPVVLHRSARQAVTAAIDDALARGAQQVLAQPTAAGQGTGAVQGISAELRPTILSGVSPDWPIAAADLFGPVASILTSNSDEETVALVNGCRYRLAASVFGAAAWAGEIAARLDVGHVSINDLIVPTADPGVPFGGCGESGFGVTRGAEGLLAMTRPKVIARHRGRLYLHLRPRHPDDAARLLRLLRLLHGRRR